MVHIPTEYVDMGQYSSFAIFAQYFEKVRGTIISIL
jgi:hypothetical protein